MSKVLHCQDVGFDCDGVVRAGIEEEVLAQAAETAARGTGVIRGEANTFLQNRD